MHWKMLCVLGVMAPLATATSTAHADSPPETFPLSKVKRGLKGYGLTTFKGTAPERFEFEVISVTKNFLPKMDIILVKSDDKKVQLTGFWQGMSGSPLFVDGKLMCAFSYGFRFNKVALGGCTPIEYMKKEGFKTPRKIDSEATKRLPSSKSKSRSGKSTSGTRNKGKRTMRRAVPQTVASIEEWLRVAPNGDVSKSLGTANSSWLTRAPLPAAPARSRASKDDKGMTAAALPLAMSGFTTPAFEQAKLIMANYALEPMQAGGTGNSNEGPTEFKFGAPIAVQLLRGDMSAAATGTVSYVDGDRVLAFGHPLFQAGEIYAPVAAAEIHTVVPSAFSAFIVASPLRELGTLVQDRQSTIMADTSFQTSMVPVRITIEVGEGRNKEKGTFNVDVLNNRFFTGTLATICALNAVSHYLPDRDRVTIKMTSSVKIKGYPPLKFTDYLYSGSGAMRAIASARGLRVLVPLLMNPFAPVEIESVELSAKITYATNYGDIESLRLAKRELTPGKMTYVDVELSTYDGKTITERVPFAVPKKFAGSIVKVEVTAGDSASLDVAPPENLDQLVAAFRKLLPGNVYAVTLYSADEGAAIDGILVHDLPASALDRLNTSTATIKKSKYKVLSRSIYRSKRVLNGRKSVLVKIADLD